MKVSYSIFAILLSILCIFYLLFYPEQDSTFSHHFSAKVFAREPDSHSRHDTLANALSLSLDTSYSERIAANDTHFYCISPGGNVKITLTSPSAGNLKISILSDTGKNISFRSQSSADTRIFTPTPQSRSGTSRIFICLVNQSVQPCPLKIRIAKADRTAIRNPKIKATKKPDNNTISNPIVKATKKPVNRATLNPVNRATKKPDSTTITNPVSETKKPDGSISPNPVSETAKKPDDSAISVHPQFISVKPGDTEDLHIKNARKSPDFIWISSNPSCAAVSNGKVQAREEGIAVIYVHEKDSGSNATSCLVRVIEGI